MYDLNIKTKNNNQFEIYRGDYEAYRVYFKDDKIADVVDKIYFSSKALGICGVEMELNEDLDGHKTWTYEFLPQRTSTYRAGNYSYAIEVVFIGNKPVSRDGLVLVIKERENPRMCNL